MEVNSLIQYINCYIHIYYALIKFFKITQGLSSQILEFLGLQRWGVGVWVKDGGKEGYIDGYTKKLKENKINDIGKSVNIIQQDKIIIHYNIQQMQTKRVKNSWVSIVALISILVISANTKIIKFQQEQRGLGDQTSSTQLSDINDAVDYEDGEQGGEGDDDEPSPESDEGDAEASEDSQTQGRGSNKSSKTNTDIAQNPVTINNNQNPVNKNGKKDKKRGSSGGPRKATRGNLQEQGQEAQNNEDDKQNTDNADDSSSSDTAEDGDSAEAEDYVDYDRSLEEGDQEDTGTEDNSQDDSEDPAQGQQELDQQEQDQYMAQQQNQLLDPSDKTKLKKKFDEFNSEYAQNNNNNDQSQIVLRFVIYSDAANKVKKHNSDKNRTYNIEINQFADETLEEFQSKYFMKNLGKQPKLKGVQFKLPQPEAREDLRPIDWNVRNATTKLKHQRQCGSCWAFSVLGALQSHIFLKKKGPLQWLSQQQLLDCCDEAGFGCKGCSGSWLGQPLNYLALQGVATYDDYPYVARPQYCVEGVRTKKYLNPKSSFNLVKGVQQLAYALLKGPVSVILDSSNWDPLYKNGIFNHCPNQNFQYSHAGVLVARTKKGIWTVRNSWGPRWGEGGHIRLPPGNSCGISDWGVIPILQQ